jgi:hypothetical protein
MLPDIQPVEMTTSAMDMVDAMNQPKDQAPTQDPKLKQRNDEFRARIEASKGYRRKLIPLWSTNVDYRRGKPFTSQPDEDQIAVNLDWALVKAKQAQLFSQVPQARVMHGEDLLPAQTPWAITFQKKLNDIIAEAGIESAMDECLPDCINTAGIGTVLVSYEAIVKDVPLPIDPANPAAGTTSVPKVMDRRYLVQRISPADLLWPINFTGANFDHAPWIGRSGRVTWSEAVQQFGLKEADKENVLSEDRPSMDRLTSDVDRDKLSADDMVGFDEVFFYEQAYDSDATSYKTIHHLVFVNGKTEPVIDEPWKGQKIQDDGSVLGAQKYPIRTLTLAYLSDESIPPSDSAIARPQIDEINESRTQMIRQRQRSIPIRTANVNLLDPSVLQGLMRGTWQNIVPVQGDGSRAIQEVSRSSFPPENYKFYEMAKSDLGEMWNMSSNQLGSGEGIETKGEASSIQAGIGTRLVRERAIVASFFVGIAEVLGGLLCLFEDPTTFGQGFDPKFSQLLRYSVLADSTVLLDANQKIARLDHFLNTYAKTGWIKIEPVLQEIAQLSGLDPNAVVVAPEPKPPVEPNISLRLTGVEDLLNPLSLSMLIKSGQAPSAEQIEQAKTLIQQAVVPPQPPPGQDPLTLRPGDTTMGQAPMLPGQPMPSGPLPPPIGGTPPGQGVPPPPPPKIGEAHPAASALPKINDRSEPGGRQ